jgi:ferrochelatase
MSAAFDAVFLLGFGGPERPEEIRPFIAHVLKGRPVPPSRIETVAHHYEAIGGRSPYNDWTERQRAALEQRLAALGTPLPVHMGMWHAAPFCEDVLRKLTGEGVRKLLVVIVAAFYDESTVQRYKGVMDAAVAAVAVPDLQVVYAESVEQDDGFYRANVEHIREAADTLPAPARLLFTAHSVPTEVGHSSGYVERYERAAARIARELGVQDYRCVYQSRSGAPQDPWLEPDVCDALAAEATSGAQAALVAPIGFVSDHVEVLFDLDVEAAAKAKQLGLPFARASTVGAHAAYIGALADAVVRAG